MSEPEKKFERLYIALTKNVSALEARVKELLAANELLKEERKQWLAEKINQQNIIQQAIDRANAMSNQYLEANRKLHEEITRLKNGDKH